LHSSYAYDGIAVVASLFTVGIVFVFLYLVLGLILVSCVIFSRETKVKDVFTYPVLSGLLKCLLRVSVSVLFGAWAGGAETLGHDGWTLPVLAGEHRAAALTPGQASPRCAGVILGAAR